ncbi:MAG: hypothetical protein IJS28_04645 [Synergistaceae bacterium]|nr:hypothetical protein [Synergistaceae bacterium]
MLETLYSSIIFPAHADAGSLSHAPESAICIVSKTHAHEGLDALRKAFA